MKDAIEKCKQLAEEYPIGTEVWDGQNVKYTVIGYDIKKDRSDLDLQLWDCQLHRRRLLSAKHVTKTPPKKSLPEGWYTQWTICRELYLRTKEGWTFIGENGDGPVYRANTPDCTLDLFRLTPEGLVEINLDEYDLDSLND